MFSAIKQATRVRLVTSIADPHIPLRNAIAKISYFAVSTFLHPNSTQIPTAYDKRYLKFNLIAIFGTKEMKNHYSYNYK